MTGKCEAKVCRVTDRVCQLRLDFSTFVLAGPSTDTRTTHYTSFGSVVGHSAPSRIAQTSIGEKEFILSQYQSKAECTLCLKTYVPSAVKTQINHAFEQIVT